MAKEMFTGAEIFLKSLEAEGVDEIFGYPGGVILNIYEALYNQDKIKHYLVRHEQAAIHAAEGYARVSGRPGVALVTSGPGATNTITGIANAYYDGYPLVVFTGQVSTDQIGNDAFQEADIVGITRSCCKHNYLVKDVKDLARVIKEAFYIATTGKPGPVVIDMPKDILTAKTTFDYPKEVKLVSYNPTYKGHPLQISKALKLLREAQRPVIISGGGVLQAGAHHELTKLAQLLEMPVAHTLMGKGTYPESSPQSLGMLGMHGNYWANYAVVHADVIFAVGTRFNDRITGCLKRFARDSQVRMNYTSARAIGSSVTQFVIGAAAMPLILYFSGSDMPQARGYFMTALICSITMVPIFWLCAYNCKETVVVEKTEQMEHNRRKIS